MRSAITLGLAAAALLAVPAMAPAQTGVGGVAATPPCDAILDNTAAGLDGELYAVKITTSAMAPRTDMLFDVREKGESRSDGGTLVDASGWAVGPNWRVGQDPSHVHFVFITYGGGRIMVDSGDISTAGAFDAQVIQTLGASRNGLAIPGTRSTYDVDLGPNVAPFPIGALSGGRPSAIDIAFPILVEAPTEVVPGCYVGGALPDPADTTDTVPTRGGIIGYNVYRLPDDGGAIPGPAEFTAAIADGDPSTGWQYFMDLRTLRLTVMDARPSAPGTISPLETTQPHDLTGLQNPDAAPYSGDEVMIFEDSAGVTVPRCPGCGTPADPTRAYWYAVQPVMFGTVPDFANVGWTPNGFFEGDHRIDMDSSGVADAVSLDTTVAGGHNTPEFISPQANLGAPGLGLTHGGLLFLSAPMHFDPARPLPATGIVRLTGARQGSAVMLSLATGLEPADVLAYNVYRVDEDALHRVNDQPILAQGTEANLYELADSIAGIRRLSRGGDVTYEVEVLYVDGSTRMVGSFTVSLAPATSEGRRRR